MVRARRVEQLFEAAEADYLREVNEMNRIARPFRECYLKGGKYTKAIDEEYNPRAKAGNAWNLLGSVEIGQEHRASVLLVELP